MPESHWRHGWTVDVGILVVVMLVTGSINTLSTKFVYINIYLHTYTHTLCCLCVIVFIYSQNIFTLYVFFIAFMSYHFCDAYRLKLSIPSSTSELNQIESLVARTVKKCTKQTEQMCQKSL